MEITTNMNEVWRDFKDLEKALKDVHESVDSAMAEMDRLKNHLGNIEKDLENSES